jgi:hypothetical protein
MIGLSPIECFQRVASGVWIGLEVLQEHKFYCRRYIGPACVCSCSRRVQSNAYMVATRFPGKHSKQNAATNSEHADSVVVGGGGLVTVMIFSSFSISLTQNSFFDV